MRKTLPLNARAGIAVLFVALLTTAGSAVATNEPGTVAYIGRATVLDARLQVLSSKTRAVLSDTQELEHSGELKETTFINFDNPPPIELHSLTAHATTAGENNVASSLAAVEKLVVNMNGLQLTADVIEASATAECRPESQTVATDGRSTIANLVINGFPVDGSRQQTVLVPGVAFVHIHHRSDPDVNTIVVTAVRVEMLGVPNVLSGVVDISRVKAGIHSCNPPAPAA